MLTINDAGWLTSGATILRADPTNYVVGPRTPIGICDHITDGHPLALPVAQDWRKPHHGSSAHVVIGQDGEIIQAVSFLDKAWHAHTDGFPFVGIEHCARSPGEPPWPASDPGLPLSAAQLESSAQVHAAVAFKYGFALVRHETVKGHKETDRKTDHDDCPDGVSGGFPWDKILSRAQRILDEAQGATNG